MATKIFLIIWGRKYAEVQYCAKVNFRENQSYGSGVIESGYGSGSNISSESGYGYGFGSNLDPGF
jgi:hypothetical protein